MKHKRKEISLEDLIIRIIIDENNRIAERRERLDLDTKTNLIEGNCSSKKFVGNFTKKSEL